MEGTFASIHHDFIGKGIALHERKKFEKNIWNSCLDIGQQANRQRMETKEANHYYYPGFLSGGTFRNLPQRRGNQAEHNSFVKLRDWDQSSASLRPWKITGEKVAMPNKSFWNLHRGLQKSVARWNVKRMKFCKTKQTIIVL